MRWSLFLLLLNALSLAAPTRSWQTHALGDVSLVDFPTVKMFRAGQLTEQGRSALQDFAHWHQAEKRTDRILVASSFHQDFRALWRAENISPAQRAGIRQQNLSISSALRANLQAASIDNVDMDDARLFSEQFDISSGENEIEDRSVVLILVKAKE